MIHLFSVRQIITTVCSLFLLFLILPFCGYCDETDTNEVNGYFISQISWLNNDELLMNCSYTSDHTYRLMKYRISTNEFTQIIKQDSFFVMDDTGSILLIKESDSKFSIVKNGVTIFSDNIYDKVSNMMKEKGLTEYKIYFNPLCLFDTTGVIHFTSWGFINSKEKYRFIKSDIEALPEISESILKGGTPAKRRIFSLLPKKAQIFIQKLGNGESLDECEKQQIIAGLNSLLERKDIYRENIFSDVVLEKECIYFLYKEGKKSAEDVRVFNWFLLESVFNWNKIDWAKENRFNIQGVLFLNNTQPIKDDFIQQVKKNEDLSDYSPSKRQLTVEKTYLNRNKNSIYFSGDNSIFEFNFKANSFEKIIDLPKEKVSEFISRKDIYGDEQEIFVMVENPLSMLRYNEVPIENRTPPLLEEEPYETWDMLNVYNQKTSNIRFIKKNVDYYDVSNKYFVTTAVRHLYKTDSVKHYYEYSVYSREQGRLLTQRIVTSKKDFDGNLLFPTISPDQKHILIFKCYDGKASPIIIDTSTLNQD